MIVKGLAEYQYAKPLLFTLACAYIFVSKTSANYEDLDPFKEHDKHRSTD